MSCDNVPAIAGGRPVRTRDRFLVFGQPVLGDDEVEALSAVIRSRWIGMGPKVQEFEALFAAYRGAEHAVALGSCSAALHLSVDCLDLQPGDEVITSAMTFCSTVSSIVHAGAVPVLADCDPWTFNLTVESIEEKITPRTRAVIVVHLCGRPCDMVGISALTRRHGLRLIEDCAHAVEASIDGKAVGTFGDVGCFSFYATKNLTTAEGGMAITADGQLANRLRSLALHGLSKDAWRRFGDSGYQHYDVVACGYKYNMTDLQAALGLVQLRNLPRFIQRRREIWAMYNQAFAGLPCHLPPTPGTGVSHAHHLYTPLLQLEQLRASRDHVLEAMTAENIGVGVHYLAIPQFSYFHRTFGWTLDEFPNADFVGARTVSLPLSAGLSDDDVADVCHAFRRIMLHFANSNVAPPVAQRMRSRQ